MFILFHRALIYWLNVFYMPRVPVAVYARDAVKALEALLEEKGVSVKRAEIALTLAMAVCRDGCAPRGASSPA